MSFLNRLSDVFYTARATTRLAMISQLSMSELSRPSLWSSIQIKSEDIQEDIIVFVLTKLQDSVILNGHREKDRLRKKLVESSDGMFLWVELMIQELEDGHWDVDRVFHQEVFEQCTKSFFEGCPRRQQPLMFSIFYNSYLLLQDPFDSMSLPWV